jgi:hypothetical protein
MPSKPKEKVTSPYGSSSILTSHFNPAEIAKPGGKLKNPQARMGLADLAVSNTNRTREQSWPATQGPAGSMKAFLNQTKQWS